MMNRVDIYARALELALAYTKLWMPIGFCHYLTDAILQLYHNTDYDTAFSENERLFEQTWHYVSDSISGEINNFPEIARHKPDDFDDRHRSYWFHGDDANDVRIAILKQAIEEAKEDYARKEEFDADHFNGDPIYE